MKNFKSYLTMLHRTLYTNVETSMIHRADLAFSQDGEWKKDLITITASIQSFYTHIELLSMLLAMVIEQYFKKCVKRIYTGKLIKI